jgi:transposase
MRKGFCGLSGLVKEHFDVDLFSGHLFVFFNRKRDYVKILAWDNDGLSIWSKRLERGTFEKLTETADGDFEIDSAELVMMLRGVQIEGTHRRKRYSIDRGQAA